MTTKLEQAEAIITKVEQMRKWQKEYYPISKIEYFWGHFAIIGDGRGFRCSFTEEQFFELVAFGRVRIGTHNYWIEP